MAKAKVKVRRDDLAWALKFMTVDGAHTQAVKDRLTVALLHNDGSGGGKS